MLASRKGRVHRQADGRPTNEGRQPPGGLFEHAGSRPRSLVSQLSVRIAKDDAGKCHALCRSTSYTTNVPASQVPFAWGSGALASRMFVRDNRALRYRPEGGRKDEAQEAAPGACTAHQVLGAAVAGALGFAGAADPRGPQRRPRHVCGLGPRASRHAALAPRAAAACAAGQVERPPVSGIAGRWRAWRNPHARQARKARRRREWNEALSEAQARDRKHGPPPAEVYSRGQDPRR